MQPQPARLFLTFILTSPLVITLLAGCASTQVESRLQKGLDSLGLKTAELRVSNVEHASRIALLIEAAADSILRSSRSRLVIKRAHEWRIYAVPTFRQALFLPDPGAGRLEGWTFAIQMRQYFTVGQGRNFFGDYQNVAVSAAWMIESLFLKAGEKPEEIAKFERLKTNAEAWANDHPIENSLYSRPSVIPFLHEFRVDVDQGITGTVGNIALDVRAISLRIDLLAAQLPREARWQAEYLMSELELPNRLDSLEGELVTITTALERLTDLLERGDLAIDVKSLRMLHSDIETLEERVATERGLVLADVDRQRLETLARIDTVADRILDQATANSINLIDHLIWRITLLLAVCVAGVAILLFVYTRRKRTP